MLYKVIHYYTIALQGGNENESTTERETDLRKMQSHQTQRQSDGHLRKSETQTEAGLKKTEEKCG